MNKLDRKEWIPNVVGKSWEIYWCPHDDSCSGNTSSSDEFDADWYDGHIYSYSQENDTFIVKFVGESKHYQMNLSHETVRPLEQTEEECEDLADMEDGDSLAPNTIDAQKAKWIEHVTGKYWEIYWSTNSSARSDSTSSTNPTQDKSSDDDESDCSEFEPDWYDGRIQSYSRHDNTFTICFEGEETQTHRMELSPNTIRPSVRTWISRSLFILDLKEADMSERSGCDVSKTMSYDYWKEIVSCPQSTATLENEAYLCEHDFCPVGKDFSDLSHMHQITTEQIYLRGQLVFDNDDEDNDDETLLLSEDHVNAIVQSLKLMKEAFEWYRSEKFCKPVHLCSSTTSTIMTNNYSISNSPSVNDDDQIIPSISEESGDEEASIELNDINDCMLRGISLFIQLVHIETCPQAAITRMKNKVKVVSPSNDSTTYSSRKRKRRRLNKVDDDGTRNSCENSEFLRAVWEVLDDLTEESSEESENTILLRGNIIEKAINQIIGDRSTTRYCAVMVADEIIKFSICYWDPIIDWIKKARGILGTKGISESILKQEASMIMLSVHQNERGPLSNLYDESDSESTNCDDPQYSVQNIIDCIQEVPSNNILQKVDLSLYQECLTKKKKYIMNFEDQCWSIILKCADKPQTLCSKESIEVEEDEIREQEEILKELYLSKERASALPALLNIKIFGDPSTQNPPLTRQVIDHAIEIRYWVIGFWHCREYRERFNFVSDNIVSFRPSLHIFDCPKDQYSSLQSKVLSILAYIPPLRDKLHSFDSTILSYEEDSSLSSSSKVCEALEVLRKTSYLSLIEEKLAIRLDVLRWKETVENLLEQIPGMHFDNISILNGTLEKLRSGFSKTRSILSKNLIRNQMVDNLTKKFVEEDLSNLCSEVVPKFKKKYEDARIWKERAMLILSSLLSYGNVSLPSSLSSYSSRTRCSSMVNLECVKSLIHEADEGAVIFQETPDLKNIAIDAEAWTNGINNLVGCDFISPKKCISLLQLQRENRPKGILMDPPRHAVDIWVDLLQWYLSCLGSLDITEMFIDVNMHNLPQEEAMSILMRKVGENVDMLVMGHIILNLDETHSPVFDENDLELILSKLRPSKRNKCITVKKIISTNAGRSLLSSLMKFDSGLNTKGVLIRCRFLMWFILATVFYDSLGKRTGTAVSEPSAKEAKTLLRKIEGIGELDQLTQSCESQLIKMILQTQSSLQELVTNADSLETDAAQVLAKYEKLKNVYENETGLQEVLSELRSFRTAFKSEKWSFDSKILNAIEYRVKHVIWILSTLPFPVLHENIQSRACRHNELKNVSKHTKTPELSWEVLSSIYEKSPVISLNRTGIDFEMKNILDRVTEMHENVNKWLKEASKLIPLSKRGLKRQSTCHNKKHDLVDINQVQILLNKQILKEVSISRESVVREIFDRAMSVKNLLLHLFRNDRCDEDDEDVDRCVPMDSLSLIGPSGDFLLLRFTGGTFFSIFEDIIEQYTDLSKEFLVQTKEKVAFEWLYKVLNWVNSLEECVEESNLGHLYTGASRNKLVITSKAAEDLITDGSKVFYKESELIQSALNGFQVLMTAIQEKQKLSFSIRKGGTSDSVGAFVLSFSIFCFNALRADYKKMLIWNQKARERLANIEKLEQQYRKDKDRGNDRSIRMQILVDEIIELKRQARDDLLITPDYNITEELVALLDRMSVRVEEKKQLQHDLIC